MKLVEVVEIQDSLKKIKEITDKQDYNHSSLANKLFNNINPILNKERERLVADGVDVNCPKILIFSNKDAKEHKMGFQDYINKQLEQLVLQDYKIIDYGKFDECFDDANLRIVYFYIKYTN